MNNDEIFEKHIQLLEKVNNAPTNDLHHVYCMELYGFRTALRLVGINQLIECDLYYLDQGIDRPMCCGVFLDREFTNTPSKPPLPEPPPVRVVKNGFLYDTI